MKAFLMMMMMIIIIILSRLTRVGRQSKTQL